MTTFEDSGVERSSNRNTSCKRTQYNVLSYRVYVYNSKIKSPTLQNSGETS